MIVPNRPLVKKSNSLSDYESWVREYITARSLGNTCYPHQTEDYPLVVSCPICDGPSMIDPLSMGDAPTWTCKTSYAPGHRIRLEGQTLVGIDYRSDTVRERVLTDD